MPNEPHITVDEWRAALQAAQIDAGRGFSSQELADAYHIGQEAARTRIRDASRKGLVVCVGKRTGRMSDGRECSSMTPVYQFVKRIKRPSNVKK